MIDALPDTDTPRAQDLRLVLPANTTVKELLSFAKLALRTYSDGADVRESLRPDWSPLDAYDDAVWMAYALGLTYHVDDTRPVKQALVWGPFKGYFMADDEGYTDGQLVAKAFTHAAAYLGKLQQCRDESGLFEASDQSLLRLSAKAMGLDLSEAEFRPAGHWGLVLKYRGKPHEILWNPLSTAEQLDTLVKKLDLKADWTTRDDVPCIQVSGVFDGLVVLPYTEETKEATRIRAFVLSAAIYAREEFPGLM